MEITKKPEKHEVRKSENENNKRGERKRKHIYRKIKILEKQRDGRTKRMTALDEHNRRKNVKKKNQQKERITNNHDYINTQIIACRR
jgi:hypothetical protein